MNECIMDPAAISSSAVYTYTRCVSIDNTARHTETKPLTSRHVALSFQMIFYELKSLTSVNVLLWNLCLVM